jgi:class 3 adenylate cyclase/pimeloyl-ACP methyl ester carboxylesterase
MEIPPETRYAVLEGRSIAYQRFGSGDRRQVQVITGLGNLDLWWTDATICKALVRAGSRSQYVMYDELGTGLSDPIDHVPTLEERAAELEAVMDAARFANATVSATWDACLSVVVFAAQHPERIDGLVLSVPFAQGWRSAPFEELVGWRDREQVEAYDRAAQSLVDRWGQGELAKMIMPSLATPRNVRMCAMLERARASPAMVRVQNEIAWTADVRDVLPSVQAPALVLRYPGHQLPEAATRYFAELLPNATYEELPEADDLGQLFTITQERTERFIFGTRHDADPDRALMTVLFTDIVGSTEHAAHLGDAGWREVLVAHEHRVRDEVQTAGGRLVKLTGDGSLSTFAGPARAIRCAERLCAARDELGVEIRAGLHTGECEVIDDDIAGMAVHIAARVSEQAQAGEVLVSRTIRDLITGSGIALQPRGAHELKGVPGTWELFAVGAETGPLPAPDQTRHLRPTDRVVLLAARHTPGLLRAASRIGTRADRR